MSVNVLLADDHALVRAGLASLLGEDPDYRVVGEAKDGREAVALARKLRPDVILMDVFMPDLNGLEATRQIRAFGLPTKIIALSMNSDRKLAVRMLRAGAAGFVLKDCDYQELLRAVSTVMTGRTYLTPEVTDLVVNELLANGHHDEDEEELTPREREVLQLIAEGHTTKSIAAKLGISPKTVETHRRRLMQRLELHSVASLTKYAIREGLTTLDL